MSSDLANCSTKIKQCVQKARKLANGDVIGIVMLEILRLLEKINKNGIGATEMNGSLEHSLMMVKKSREIAEKADTNTNRLARRVFYESVGCLVETMQRLVERHSSRNHAALVKEEHDEKDQTVIVLSDDEDSLSSSVPLPRYPMTLRSAPKDDCQRVPVILPKTLSFQGPDDEEIRPTAGYSLSSLPVNRARYEPYRVPGRDAVPAHPSMPPMGRGHSFGHFTPASGEAATFGNMPVPILFFGVQPGLQQLDPAAIAARSFHTQASYGRNASMQRRAMMEAAANYDLMSRGMQRGVASASGAAAAAPTAVDGWLRCDICSKRCKTAGGLYSHRGSHPVCPEDGCWERFITDEEKELHRRQAHNCQSAARAL